MPSWPRRPAPASTRSSSNIPKPRHDCMCFASRSARPVFVGNFVGERTVNTVSDKVSDKGKGSEGGAKHVLMIPRHAALLCLLAALLAGCAGYRLGPTGGQTAGARSVQINPFVNQTIEPRL